MKIDQPFGYDLVTANGGSRQVHVPDVMNAQFLVWNPAVHGRFQEALVFYLLKVRVFEKGQLLDSLKSLLHSEGIGSFRIYEVYGTYDLILRVWVPKGEEGDFALKVEKLDKVHAVRPFPVWVVAQHWCWTSRPLEQRSLDRLTPDSVKLIQEGFEAEHPSPEIIVKVGNLENEGLLRIHENGGSDTASPPVRFFTFITRPESVDRGSDNALLEKLLTLLTVHEQKQLLQRTSLYSGTGFAWLLLKAEATDFYRIGDFVVEINNVLATYGGITSTHVVAEREPHIQDRFEQKSFDRISQRDLRVAAVLPELYASSLDDLTRGQVEQWIRAHVLGADLDEERLELLRECLCGVLEDDEESFVSPIAAEFRRVERYLREREGRLIAALLPRRSFHEVLAEALKRYSIEGRKEGNEVKINAKFLTLGHRLDLLSYVLGQSDVADIADLRWTEVSNLRNLIVHNVEDLLPQWQQHLSTFVGFLLQFDRVSGLIDLSLGPANGN